MSDIINLVNSIIWSDYLVGLCLLAGILFTVLTRFLQLRLIKDMICLMFSGKSSDAGISSFQALSLSLSGRVGTGNIAGVAAAIFYGGPGAVVWMWIIAFLGASSAFVEAALGQVYKTKINGQYRGGPAFYIEKGLNIKWYAVLFAICALMATGFLLPATQSNSIAESLYASTGIPKMVTALTLVGILAVIIFGGVKRISRVAEIIVPFMALIYIIVALIIIVVNISELPGLISMMISSAFGTDAAFGGMLGSAIAWGVKRGIYSNEAGQGTAPHAAAAAEVSHPAKQGLVQAFSVYIDTLFVCSATAFMILLTNQYNVEGIDSAQYVPGAASIEFTQGAVTTLFADFGAIFVSICLTLFAFTTIMAYYYQAETNVVYLTYRKDKSGALVLFNKFLCLAAAFYGAISTPGDAWAIGDIGVGMMAWTNVIAILLLAKPALLVLKDYEAQKKANIDPVFNPKKLGIKNADFWEK